MNIYHHLTIEGFHALSKRERLGLSKSEIPLLITIDKAEKELVEDVGRNALSWLGTKDRVALDCRRIVDGQKWKVPILTSAFLPRMLLLAPWRFDMQEFLHLFTYLGEQQFYHWDAVNLDYDNAYRLIFSHSTYYHHGMVSVTDFCNLKCRMCSYHGEDPRYEFSKSRKKRQKQELTDANYYGYIDQLPKGKDLLFCGTGELFVSNKAIPYLKYAHKQGCYIRILTNGMLITPDVAKTLVELDVAAIIFSIDGHRADLVENIRLGSNLDLILKNMKILMDIRNKTGSKMSIGVHCSLLPTIIPHKQGIVDFWQNFGIDTLGFFLDRVDWHSNVTMKLSEEQPSMGLPCWNSLSTAILTTNGLIAPCPPNQQNEWGPLPMDWLVPFLPNGLEHAVRHYRKLRLDPKSQFRINCAKCVSKQAHYVAADGENTHINAYNFTGLHTAGEAGFVKDYSK